MNIETVTRCYKKMPLRVRIRVFLRGGKFTYYGILYTGSLTFKRFSRNPSYTEYDQPNIPRGRVARLEIYDDY